MIPLSMSDMIDQSQTIDYHRLALFFHFTLAVYTVDKYSRSMMLIPIKCGEYFDKKCEKGPFCGPLQVQYQSHQKQVEMDTTSTFQILGLFLRLN